MSAGRSLPAIDLSIFLNICGSWTPVHSDKSYGPLKKKRCNTYLKSGLVAVIEMSAKTVNP